MRPVAIQTARPSRRGAPTLAVLVLLATSQTFAQDSTSAERRVSAGVFSTAQASRGENGYKINCVSCHATSDYTGENFQFSWVTRTAFDLFDVIRSQMPEDNPGILAREEYVDIVAYIFSLNAFPSGESDLPGDDESLKQVRIDAPPAGLAVRRDRGRTAPHSLVRRGR